MRLIVSDLAAERGGRPVFEGLSFSVGAGELLFVTGANGVGKSTLLRILAGLLRPAAGQVALEPSSEEPLGAFVHYLGHLNGLKSALTARKNLEYWQRLGLGTPGGEEDALAAVGLGHLADTPAGFLSAGQKRRLAIARLLIARRPVWLLDEPTTALDAASERSFGLLLARHLGEGGIAIAASHALLPIEANATIVMGERA